MTTDDRTRVILWFEKQARMFGLAAEALNELDAENEPLTLKELRKYKHGDPIYLVDTEKPENTGWELWAADLPDGHPDTIAYGKTWFAYRRPPRKDDEA